MMVLNTITGEFLFSLQPEGSIFMPNAIFDLNRYAALARQAAAEGTVLLKNDRNALPLAAGSRIALFGRAQFHYYKSGTGSGGLVNTRRVVDIPQALQSPAGYHCDAAVCAAYTDWLQTHPYDTGSGWAKEPWFQAEMPLDEALVAQAAQRNDAAVVVIGRTAGEDQDNAAAPGSYCLTEGEEEMLRLVCRYFTRSIVLLNVGNIIDMQWVRRYDPAAVLYVWQGGQEGGLSVLDVLTGAVCPSGRLSDTIANTIADYPAADNYGDDVRNFYKEDIYVGYRYFETFAPQAVAYPFGYGLSYTQFSQQLDTWDETADGVTAVVTVANTGSCAGKNSVLLYVSAPQGKLGKPAKVLCAFGKTHTLAPGETQTLHLHCTWKSIASYDDSGITGHKAAWVLENGDYTFYLGGDVRSALPAFVLTLPLRVLEQLEPAAGPVVPFERLRPGKDNAPAYEPVPLAETDQRTCREERLPAALPFTGDTGLRLWDVADGTARMEDFLAQFRDEDLCCLVRGEGMSSPRVTPGTAGAFGCVSDALADFGLPTACCSDGPSGIRMDCGNIAFAMPNGTCLACTFNEELSEELYGMEGLELRKNHIETLLGPGINLHRHPLNGRNFEYFSEDPLLTGKMAAAQLRGMNRWGVMGTIKHFACNSQEHNRHMVEAVVSERALRELYLRCFEVAIAEGGTCAVMTSYNPVNGYWTASNYDLVTTILREQWGFTGIVMTDWWAECNDFGQPGTVQNAAAMVRAQNDLYMVATSPAKNTNGDNLAQALQDGTLTRGELGRCAANICRYLITTPAFRRLCGQQSELDKQLAACAAQDEIPALTESIAVEAKPNAVLDPACIDTGAHQATLFCVHASGAARYDLVLTCRAAADSSALAQLPVSVFINQHFLQTITLAGSQTDWAAYTVEIPPQPDYKPFYIKLYFGQSGMEIQSAELRGV